MSILDLYLFSLLRPPSPGGLRTSVGITRMLSFSSTGATVVVVVLDKVVVAVVVVDVEGKMVVALNYKSCIKLK